MSTDDQCVVVRTRRALNSLQHSPNGTSIVGISPRKTNANNRKKVVYDPKETNSLKRRTSISLPDICSFANSKDASILNKSATSTPHKLKMNTAATPVKYSKTNISIIIEEKENPNYYLSCTSLNDKHELVEKKETREIAIQCNKSDEDIVFSDLVEGTNYWKLIALKRVKALLETREENDEIHKMIEMLDEKNESLRQSIKDLHDLISEYQEIKKSLLDLEDSEGNDNDSGYDV